MHECSDIIIVLVCIDRAQALMIHSILLFFFSIFCHASISKKGDPLNTDSRRSFATSNWRRVFDGEMKAYVSTLRSLSFHRSGVIFHHICRFALFPIFLQACPFVTCWMWVMHHTGLCQTLPSGLLVHRSALMREPCIHLDSLMCVCMCVSMHEAINLCVVVVCVCVCVCMVPKYSAPVCICVFALPDSWALPAAVELVISRSCWRAMKTNSTDVTSPPGWVLTESITTTPLRDCLQ